MAVTLNDEDDFKPKDLKTLLTEPTEEGHFTLVATVVCLWLAVWSMQLGETFTVDMVAMITLKINQYYNINVYKAQEELEVLYTNETGNPIGHS